MCLFFSGVVIYFRPLPPCNVCPHPWKFSGSGLEPSQLSFQWELNASKQYCFMLDNEESTDQLSSWSNADEED